MIGERRPTRDATDVNETRELFRRAFGGDPTHLVRAPGRVNLIGDHIDYLNLPVLPMALGRAVTVAIRPRVDRSVRLVTAAPGMRPRHFTLGADIAPYHSGDWGNYAKAAGRWIARRYGDVSGADVGVTSDVPVATGLSSSSALVVAIALGLLAVNGLDVETLNLAEELAEAERYVGTRGGGMDQAACLGAVPGAALRIEFAPLRATPVPLSVGWRFVVASSTVSAPKSGAAREEYNRRRSQAEAALHAVAAHVTTSPSVMTPRELLDGHGTVDLLAVGERLLSPQLMRRLRHVVTEAERVTAAEAAAWAGDGAAFGRLMLASHASLRDDFDVSCTELDRVVEIAGSAGAAGAKLTGAGFGGSVVVLCESDASAHAVMGALDREFYRSRVKGTDVASVRFMASPGGGASVSVL